eukprot:TRINITY_DN5536_c0_g1_i1.p1 TRINITY_DN5536_c0_g1~~TRINITY_DN5536_c0_g1_i1.p1  ORF type:complete len:943 (+),score=101.77 TRINITY_DN5536_c0_g1_i1:61-2889(+)
MQLSSLPQCPLVHMSGVLLAWSAMSAYAAAECSSGCNASSRLVSNGIWSSQGIFLLQHRHAVVGQRIFGRADETCGFVKNTVECGSAVLHNCTRTSALQTRGLCPSECGLIAPNPYFGCAASCASPRTCFSLSGPGYAFGDTKRHICRVGSIPGCQIYASSKTSSRKRIRTSAQLQLASADECAECSSNFVLEDGLCYFDYHGSRRIIAGILVVVAVIVCLALPVILYRMCWLPQGDPEVLRLGWAHRARCLVSSHTYNDPAKTAFEPFPLSTDMTSELVAGTGLCLYYTHLRFMLCGSILTCLATSALWFNPGDLGLDNSADSCTMLSAEIIEERASNINDFQTRLTVGLFCFWALLLMLSLWHAAQQHRTFRKLDHHTTLMADFGVMITGLPPDATEKEVEDFLNILNPGALVGVSIAYDYHNTTDRKIVQQLLDRHLNEMALLHFSNNSAEEIMRIRNAREKWKSRQEHDPREFLLSLRCSGTAFGVCRTEQDRERLQAAWSAKRPLFRERSMKYRPTLSEIVDEPQTFLWENFGVTAPERYCNSCIQALILAGYAVVLGVAVFLPAMFLMSRETETTGSGGTDWECTILGIVVSVVNVSLFVLVDNAVHRIGFRFKGDLDFYNFVGCVIIVLINTAFNIRNSIVGNKHVSEADWPENGPASSVLNLAFRNDTCGKVWAALFPGLLLVPYILYPIYKHLLSLKSLLFYWVSLPFWPIYSHRDLRSNPQLTLREAEHCLQAEPIQIEFDYANMICVACAAFYMLFFERNLIGYACMMLIVWCVWTHVSQVYCHLRLDRLVEYSTPTLSDVVDYAWALPVSMIASASAWWSVQAGIFGSGFHIISFLIALSIHWIALHFVLHYTAVASGGSGVSYLQASKRLRYDFFNTNPICVLKSRHCQMGKPLVYFQRGKEYLQQRSSWKKEFHDSSSTSSEEGTATL